MVIASKQKRISLPPYYKVPSLYSNYRETFTFGPPHIDCIPVKVSTLAAATYTFENEKFIWCQCLKHGKTN